MGTQSLFLIVFFLSLLHSTVFVSSQLSATQNSSMINLFELHQDHDPDTSWDLNTDPCSWEGVTCNIVDNAVTRLELSGLGFYNSSFISIPCQIDSLEVLDISYSELDSIPDEFVTSCGKLPTLKEITFSWNRISGDLPAFNKGFTKLESLDLSNNLLSGSIGRQLDGLVALKSLNLASNGFTGSIPTSLGKAKGLKYLDLSHNHLQGRIPNDLLSLPKLQTVDLSYNMLVGTIPEKISSSLVNLILGVNSLLYGSILLINFGMLENLVQLDLRNNSLSGNIPADIGLCQKLRSLDLSENQLSGILPKQLGNLKRLQFLNLQLNHFVGKIPREITQLSNLIRLDISSNSFSGSIPSSISNLTNLQYLYLQDNYLRGSIPRNIGNMSSLIEVQLGNNHLSGEIPSMPIALQALNLSKNSLDGEILPSLVRLTNLKSLDLSNNNISGTLRVFLAHMSQLAHLNLSHNKFSGDIASPYHSYQYDFLTSLDLSHNILSGSIPATLQHLGYEAFVGNLDLCGPPLTGRCNAVEGGDASWKQKVTKSKDNFYIGLYVSIGLGLYLGFWGVCGTLVLKDAWRHAYFNLVDNIFNRIYVTAAIYVARFKRNAHT